MATESNTSNISLFLNVSKLYVLLTWPVGHKIAAAQITAYFPNNNFITHIFIVEIVDYKRKKAENFNLTLYPDTKFL